MEVSSILIIDSFDGRQILGPHSALLPDSHMPQGSIQFMGLVWLSTPFEVLSKRAAEVLQQTCRFTLAFTNARVVLRRALNFSVHFEMGKKGNFSDPGCAFKTHGGS